MKYGIINYIGVHRITAMKKSLLLTIGITTVLKFVEYNEASTCFSPPSEYPPLIEKRCRDTLKTLMDTDIRKKTSLEAVPTIESYMEQCNAANNELKGFFPVMVYNYCDIFMNLKNYLWDHDSSAKERLRSYAKDPNYNYSGIGRVADIKEFIEEPQRRPSEKGNNVFSKLYWRYIKKTDPCSIKTQD